MRSHALRESWNGACRSTVTINCIDEWKHRNDVSCLTYNTVAGCLLVSFPSIVIDFIPYIIVRIIPKVHLYLDGEDVLCGKVNRAIPAIIEGRVGIRT